MFLVKGDWETAAYAPEIEYWGCETHSAAVEEIACSASKLAISP